jgi:hypothetical protein
MKLLLGLIGLMVWSPLWADEKTVDENADYVVSPSGNYLVMVAFNKDSIGSTVTVAETANPKNQFSLAGVTGGKGASVSFSPNEQWLLVDDYVVVHSCEPRLYRHVAGAKFESLASMDVTQQISDYLKGGGVDPEMISLENWEPDSSGFTLNAQGERAHGRSPYCEVFYSIAQGRPIRKTNTRFLIDGADDAEDAKRYEESQRQQRQLQEQELNLIYRVLKRKLDPQAQQQLVVEERKWIEDREKARNDPNSGWDTITHDRIAQLAERVLENGSSGP